MRTILISYGVGEYKNRSRYALDNSHNLDMGRETSQTNRDQHSLQCGGTLSYANRAVIVSVTVCMTNGFSPSAVTRGGMSSNPKTKLKAFVVARGFT